MTIEIREPMGSDRVRDQRIDQVVSLVPPAQLLEDMPLRPEHEEVVVGGRSDVAAIANQADDRLLVVVGPCSVHDAAAALDYAQPVSYTHLTLPTTPYV